MPDSRRLRPARPESGRTEITRLDGGNAVVAKHTVGEGGVSWIQLSRFEDAPIESEEGRPLPKR